MAAICGAIGWGAGPTGLSELARVCDALEPWGAPAVAAMSAGRCSVVVAAHSPTASATEPAATVPRRIGDFVVIADVHLHARARLRGQLGITAAAPADDLDLLSAAYAKWGPSFVDHISGDYAIAIADAARGGLLLVRDHVGNRPLAYWQGSDQVAFASTALALTGFPGVGHELDTERAAEVIVLAYGTDRTFVKGVRHLLPGCSLWIDEAGVRSSTWWKPTMRIHDEGSLERHAAALRTSLEEAVASSLDGADSVGVLLSGGLDSTSVAAVAAKMISPNVLRSYTSVPPATWSGSTPGGWIPNERFAVEALAQRVPNLRPQFIHVRGQSPFEHAEALWELGAGPERNPMNMMWFYSCMKDASADGIDVLLTGGAGNQAFSADGPLWLAELARRGHLIRVMKEASAWAAARRRPLSKVLRGQLLWPLLPERLRQDRARRKGLDELTGWIGATAILPERLADMDLTAILPEKTEPHRRGWTRDLRMVRVGAAQADLDFALRAHFGCELRDPTADRELFELGLTQPEWWRRHDGISRSACRLAMRDVLPPEIVDRTTLGAQLPDWFDRLSDARAELSDELEQMRDHPASREVIDVAKLDLLFQNWPSREHMTDADVVDGYQLALSRATMVSRYMRWFEGRARRIAGGGPTVVLHPIT